MIRRARAPGHLLVALLGLAACGGEPQGLDLAAGREVSLTVTVRETVSWRGRSPAKALRVALRGTAEAESDDEELLVATVDWAELTYVDADGTRVEMSTDGMQEEPVAGGALTAARRGLIEGLVGKDISLRLGHALSGDDTYALRAVTGLAAALTAARREVEAAPGMQLDVVDVACGGLEPMVEDDVVRESLIAAGLCPITASEAREGAAILRGARVHVPGRGWTLIALRGKTGGGRGDSPTVRLDGRPDGEPTFSGDVGAAPPAALGEVRVHEIRVTAETEYDTETLRPQRGSVTVELPYAAGPLVRRATEFLLLVRE